MLVSRHQTSNMTKKTFPNLFWPKLMKKWYKIASLEVWELFGTR